MSGMAVWGEGVNPEIIYISCGALEKRNECGPSWGHLAPRESETQEEEMGTEVTAAASGETRESWEENPIDFHNNNVVQNFFRFIVHIQAFLSASF